jgi:hypothetical protein
MTVAGEVAWHWYWAKKINRLLHCQPSVFVCSRAAQCGICVYLFSPSLLSSLPTFSELPRRRPHEFSVSSNSATLHRVRCHEQSSVGQSTAKCKLIPHTLALVYELRKYKFCVVVTSVIQHSPTHLLKIVGQRTFP